MQHNIVYLVKLFSLFVFNYTSFTNKTEKRHKSFLTFLFYIIIVVSKGEYMDILCELHEDERGIIEEIFEEAPDRLKNSISIFEVDKNKKIIEAGSPCTHIYVILSGRVTGVEWPLNQKMYPFKDFGRGDFFGEIEVFADMSEYRICIITQTKCKIATIPSDIYMNWLYMNNSLLKKRSKINIKRLITQTADARKYLFMDGTERLMFHLLRKYNVYEDNVKIYKVVSTRGEIAEEIGFCVKTLDRSIKKLKDNGFIDLKAGKIVISKEQYISIKNYMDKYIL